VFSCIGVVAAALIFAGVWALTIASDPLAQFNPGSTEKPGSSQTAPETSEPVASGEETPTPTLDPEEVLLSQADMMILNDKFVNILLIGVDHAEERETWGGKKAFHADVMIVLCINKETGKVSMISLPRDTYAKIPGVMGIYKLNASLDCGGGWPANGEETGGFDKVCEAAEWMLGGIQVDYYFAVDMGAVKGLVDAIGGVDYDLDITFDIQDRYYEKGQRHMDGQAVLDYLRVRKKHAGTTQGIIEGSTGDSARVNRQKMMLKEIFRKIRDTGLLASIPGLIDAFEGNLYYNLTFNQIAALAYYSLSVNIDDIEMYSMSGDSLNIFNWNFVITNQAKRQQIIKEVFGMDVPKYSDYTKEAAQLLWGNMLAPHYVELTQPAITKITDILTTDAAKPPKPTPSPTPSPTTTPDVPAEPTESAEPTPTPSPIVTPTPPPGGYRQYDPNGPEWTLYNQVMAEYDALVNCSTYEVGADLLALASQFKTDFTTLCGMFAITTPKSTEWRLNYESDKEVNEIKVDFN
jgi:LCP family protein required for cell wall assembly